jgi:tetratricopeptide (TPR) repeat protein
LGRRLLLALLEDMGKTEALVAEIDAQRAEPIVDAGLLAQGASALRRLGREGDALRAFGELIERAPRDPWTLAYVGDRLRAEGMFDEAGAAYDSLARLVPGDASVTLRQALAHAGAGRLDVATRLLERVTQTGGRGDDGRLGELASITRAFLLSRARGNNPPDVEAELDRRLLQTPLPDVHGLLLVESDPADDAVAVRIVRDDGEKAQSTADLDATALGLSAIRLERGMGAAKILLRRDEQLGPARTRKVRVAALVFSSDRRRSTLVERELEIAADGKDVELAFDGEQLL